MKRGLITAHTEQIAAELRGRFEDNPRGELNAWLRVAHQREAMVTRIYGLPEIRRRVPDESEGGAAKVAAKAIKGIWAQEEGHVRWLGALRLVEDDPAPILQEIQGKIEGEVTLAGCSGSFLVRLAIAIGALLDIVPDFAKEIDAMSLRQFYEFCSELEDTAGQGYHRMIALSEMLAKDDDNPIFHLPYELTRILCEERYHAMVLEHIVQWTDKDGRSFRNLPAVDCATELHALGDKHLDMLAADLIRSRACGRPVPISGAPKTGEWISDGGLGALFSEFGFHFQVVHPTSLE